MGTATTCANLCTAVEALGCAGPGNAALRCRLAQIENGLSCADAFDACETLNEQAQQCIDERNPEPPVDASNDAEPELVVNQGDMVREGLLLTPDTDSGLAQTSYAYIVLRETSGQVSATGSVRFRQTTDGVGGYRATTEGDCFLLEGLGGANSLYRGQGSRMSLGEISIENERSGAIATIEETSGSLTALFEDFALGSGDSLSFRTTGADVQAFQTRLTAPPELREAVFDAAIVRGQPYTVRWDPIPAADDQRALLEISAIASAGPSYELACRAPLSSGELVIPANFTDALRTRPSLAEFLLTLQTETKTTQPVAGLFLGLAIRRDSGASAQVSVE
ncbi:MAG: hypothetical protein AAGF12_31060 [Myxococcota bacterium]